MCIAKPRALRAQSPGHLALAIRYNNMFWIVKMYIHFVAINLNIFIVAFASSEKKMFASVKSAAQRMFSVASVLLQSQKLISSKVKACSRNFRKINYNQVKMRRMI